MRGMKAERRTLFRETDLLSWGVRFTMSQLS
jgi:hypothetical protein